MPGLRPRVRAGRVAHAGRRAGVIRWPGRAPSGDDPGVLADLWPRFGLSVRTPRLELRLPRDRELAVLGGLARRGVHAPGERPFLTPWTAGEPQDRARFVLQEHWRQLGAWSAGAWRLGLGRQRRGYGTEARTALLALAFDHLGADAALTEVFQDNHSSQGVSRKLGYEADGISRDARGDEVVVSDRLRLTRHTWRSQARPGVTVTGFPACR